MSTENLLIQAYLAGERIPKIGNKYGYTDTSVPRVIQALGYETNPVGRRAISTKTRAEVVALGTADYTGTQIVEILRGQASLPTVCRILNDTTLGITTKNAVGMVIFHPETNKILIHDEIYPGKYRLTGSHSIQMTYMGPNEKNETKAFTRLAEREVFAGLPLAKTGLELVMEPLEDGIFMWVQVADVMLRVKPFVLTSFGAKQAFASPTVEHHRWASWMDLGQNLNGFRPGAKEVINYLVNTRFSPYTTTQITPSELNMQFWKSRGVRPEYFFP